MHEPSDGTGRDAPAGDALRALGPVPGPLLASAKPGGQQAKAALRRLTAWQLAPLVAHIEALQNHTAAVLDELATRSARLEARLDALEGRTVPLLRDGVGAAHAGDRDLTRSLAELEARLARLEDAHPRDEA